jgi:hypothetical protein
LGSHGECFSSRGLLSCPPTSHASQRRSAWLPPYDARTVPLDGSDAKLPLASATTLPYHYLTSPHPADTYRKVSTPEISYCVALHLKVGTQREFDPFHRDGGWGECEPKILGPCPGGRVLASARRSCSTAKKPRLARDSTWPGVLVSCCSKYLRAISSFFWFRSAYPMR